MGSKVSVKEDTSMPWLVGFFIGDGYFTYGRVGVDTITPEFAEKVFKKFKELTNSEIKVEVYGNPEIFKNFLPTDYLQYPKRKANHSDYVKIKIDSVQFASEFKLNIQNFLEKLENFDTKTKATFLQGFFDAEATVSPDSTIQIDLKKSSLKILEGVSKILKEVDIKNTIKEYKSKVRLTVVGGTKNIINLLKFKEKIGFSSPTKNRELSTMIEIYKKVRETRTKEEISKLLLNELKTRNQAEIKELMSLLGVKYDTLKRVIKILVSKKLLVKRKTGKKVLVCLQ